MKSSRVRKSVGTERTFATDVNDDEEIFGNLGISGKTAERKINYRSQLKL